MTKQFKFIRLDGNMDPDEYRLKPMRSLVDGAISAFLPVGGVSEKLLKMAETCPFPVALLRGASMQAQLSGDMALKRHVELEEAVEKVRIRVEEFKRSYYEDELPTPEEDIQDDWTSVDWLTSLISSLHRDEDDLILEPLSTGRVLTESEILASYVLLQCERCICAYMAGDLEQFAHRIADAYDGALNLCLGMQTENRSYLAKSNAKKAHAGKPKNVAMVEIEAEWESRKRAGETFRATAFAKEMAKKYDYMITVEHIKNCQTDWNRKYHPAS